IGFGKGIEHNQARLSAQYEALEFYTSIISNFPDYPYLYLSYTQAEQQGYNILNDKVPAALLSNEELKNVPLAWVEFTEYYDSNDKVLVPALSTHPGYLNKPFSEDKFDYSSIYIEFTNNGTAIGCSLSDALIHAISEVVERDSISKLLINSLLKENQPITEIDLRTLPQHQNHLVKHIQKECPDSVIKVFKSENVLDMPVYAAVLYHQNFMLPIKGFGASLNNDYALERALLEVLEQYHAYHYGPKEEAELALKALAKHPQLLKCLVWDIDRISKKTILKPYSAQELDLPTDSKAYLNILINKCYQKGFKIYLSKRFMKNNIYTIQVIIPQADEFFAILTGVINLAKYV
ncbi:MAG: YcaO-like family protein, partial [Burkholderiales bacterium]